MPTLDLAAERSHHGLLAITDAQHWNARGEQRLRRLRRAGLVHAGWPTRKDNGARPLRRDRGLGLAVGNDLGIDAGLAHAPCDKLGHLAAEIDDEDADLLWLARCCALLRGAGWRTGRRVCRFAHHGRWL